MTYRFLFAILAFVLSGATWSADLGPDALAKSVTDEVLAIVRADKDLQSGNRKKVLELVESKILPHFNFTRMTQLAMGRNWRQASPEQRKVLVVEFRTLLVRTYSTALEQYSSQTIDVRPVSLKPGEAETSVRMQINQPGGPPIPMDYRMEKTPNGWKVYDVSVEGVSIVTTYRSTFNSEVTKSGIDGLIKVLTEQNRKLEARSAEKK